MEPRRRHLLARGLLRNRPTNSTIHVTISNSAISFEGTGVDGKTAGLAVTPAGGNTEVWRSTAPVDSAKKWAKSAIAILPGKYDLSLAEMNFNTPSPEIARARFEVVVDDPVQPPQ